jgi:DnaK suppressor protein
VLEAERLELVSALHGRVRQLAIEDGEAELIDRIQGMSHRDETAVILNRISCRLDEIDRALRAIEDHTYGNCIRCEQAIAVRRLQSLPWAPYCVRCQEQVEATETNDPRARFDEPQAA